MRPTEEDPNSASIAGIVRIWRDSGLQPKTIKNYMRWVRLLRRAWKKKGKPLEADLTFYATDRFARRYARSHGVDAAVVRSQVRSALHAWSWGLRAAGYDVPTWAAPGPKHRKLPRLLAAFAEYRRARRGVVPSTLRRDADDVSGFAEFLRARKRPYGRIRISDVDAYVLHLGERRMSRRTIARACGTIRAFLRYLHAIGRLKHDLAPSVAGPRLLRWEHPPRALPWKDVVQILRVIDRSTRTGLRDYALLLTMAMYGLGAAEILGLQLEDIDWSAGLLRIRRRKTGKEMDLPLLPIVGRALVAYLRRGRPGHTLSRTVFVRRSAPHTAIKRTTGIQYALRKYAAAAGVHAPFLGSHVLRHSHATRQITLGAEPKVVADILGHRSTKTTSLYTRAAVERLRPLALPVPR